MELKKVDLHTINNGAAGELFSEELKKVMANIADLSVESDAARKITLEFTIKPTADRRSAVTIIKSSSKLASFSAHESSIYLAGKDSGAVEAFVTNPEQMTLEFNKEKTGESPS